jgi:diaminopimelate epimerase
MATPPTLPFVKAHACGNDFLLMDEALAMVLPRNGETQPSLARRHAALARRFCARNTGIGADGIEFLDRDMARAPKTAAGCDIFLRLFNSDGSEAELSGNGTRCVAAWLAHSEGRSKVALGTHGGVRRCRVVQQSGAVYTIESEMGVPRVMERAIVIEGVGEVKGAMVNVGNPHFVLFVDTPDFSAHGLAWQQLGERIATSPLFPHGTNVEFVRVEAPSGGGPPDRIGFRIYERGCGPTTSSGTGTCASSAAAMALRGAARELVAVAEGGEQTTVWPTADAPMLLTGPAEILCTGEAFDELTQTAEELSPLRAEHLLASRPETLHG